MSAPLRARRRRPATGTPEALVKRAVLDGLHAHGWPAWKINSGAVVAEHKGKRRYVQFSFAGAPDIVALMPDGRTLWVECKADKGRLSEAQRAFAALCKERGTPWVCARSWDDVAPWVRP